MNRILSRTRVCALAALAAACSGGSVSDAPRADSRREVPPGDREPPGATRDTPPPARDPAPSGREPGGEGTVTRPVACVTCDATYTCARYQAGTVGAVASGPITLVSQDGECVVVSQGDLTTFHCDGTVTDVSAAGTLVLPWTPIPGGGFQIVNDVANTVVACVPAATSAPSSG